MSAIITTKLLIDSKEKINQEKEIISKEEIPFGQAAWMKKIKDVTNEIEQLKDDPNTLKFKDLLKGEIERIEEKNEEIASLMKGPWYGPKRGGNIIKNSLFMLSGGSWIIKGAADVINVALSSDSSNKVLGIIGISTTALAVLTTGLTGFFWCLYTNSQNNMMELSNMQAVVLLAQMDHLENMSNFIASLRKLYGNPTVKENKEDKSKKEIENNLKVESDNENIIIEKKEELNVNKGDAFAECIEFLKKLNMNEISSIDKEEKIPKIVSFLVELLPKDHPIRVKYSLIANLMTSSFKMNLEKKNHLNLKDKEVKRIESPLIKKENSLIKKLDEFVIEINDVSDSDSDEERQDDEKIPSSLYLDSINKTAIQIINNNVVVVHSDFFCKHWEELESKVGLELSNLVTKNGEKVKRPLTKQESFYKINTPVHEIKEIFKNEIINN